MPDLHPVALTLAAKTRTPEQLLRLLFGYSAGFEVSCGRIRITIASITRIWPTDDPERVKHWLIDAYLAVAGTAVL